LRKVVLLQWRKGFAQKFRGHSTLYTLKNKNVVKSSFFVLFVRRFIQRTQKVYVFSFFLHFYWCICVGLGSDKWVRPFYHYTDRKQVFNLIDVRQVGITRGIHIKIRRQLGMWYAFFVSMKVRRKLLSAPPVHLSATFGGRDTTSVSEILGNNQRCASTAK